MRNKLFSIFAGLLFFVFVPAVNADEEDKLESIQIIRLAELTIQKITENKKIENFDKIISKCRGILIFPEIYEGGFFFGAKGGTGILLIRKSKNKFSGPFYFSIGGLSAGLQVGLKKGKVVMTIMTNRGLKSILKERVKFGVDIDAAVIDGVGYSAESTLRLADIYSFSDNTGLFLGGSLEGSYLQPRNDYNKALHGKKFSASEILNAKILNLASEELVDIISNIQSYNK
tara:strand:+ start:3742 stop:4431 length:690 start_codon:yes stop_codon:yes gene_type:complete